MATNAPVKIPKRHMDFTILFLVILLVSFGLVMIFSASYYVAQQQERYNHDGFFFVKKQLLGIGVGFLALAFLANFDYRKLERFKVAGLLISIALLILVLFLGEEKNGARRWFNIGGVSIQPAEIAKFCMIMFMASNITRKQQLMRSFSQGVMPQLIVMGVVAGLIYLQPNFSSVIIVGIAGFIMIIMGGANMLQMLFLGGAGLGIGAALLMAGGSGGEGGLNYRASRVEVFKDPWAHPLDGGYQIIQSLYALGSGGLFGTGLGSSRQKLLFLTYSESDFIFAIIGEELGLVGLVALLAVYFIFIMRGIRVAIHCRDAFGSLFATGIVTVIALQLAINVAVVTNSIPATGVPLPFMSAGSSSMVILLAATGILLNISKNCDFPVRGAR